jgi:hypothetical protein
MHEHLPYLAFLFDQVSEIPEDVLAEDVKVSKALLEEKVG